MPQKVSLEVLRTPIGFCILSTSFTSVSIFSVCCYSSVSISVGETQVSLSSSDTSSICLASSLHSPDLTYSNITSAPQDGNTSLRNAMSGGQEKHGIGNSRHNVQGHIDQGQLVTSQHRSHLSNMAILCMSFASLIIYLLS